MYSLCLQGEFTARHQLVGGDWGAENLLHSHPYRVEWELSAPALDEHGYLVDLVDVERALGETIGRYNGAVLNELSEFGSENPSLERFARVLWERLSRELPRGVRSSVRLWESASAWAGYEPSPS